MYSMSARAAASATGLCALCWSPWKSPCVPRSASYSAIKPRVGPVAPAGEVHVAVNGVGGLGVGDPGGERQGEGGGNDGATHANAPKVDVKNYAALSRLAWRSHRGRVGATLPERGRGVAGGGAGSDGHPGTIGPRGALAGLWPRTSPSP